MLLTTAAAAAVVSLQQEVLVLPPLAVREVEKAVQEGIYSRMAVPVRFTAAAVAAEEKHQGVPAATSVAVVVRATRGLGAAGRAALEVVVVAPGC
jgi:hypothetical protein